MTKNNWMWRSNCNTNCKSVNIDSDNFKRIWGHKKRNFQPKGNCFNWSESKLDPDHRFWFEYPCSSRLGFVCQFDQTKAYPWQWNFMTGWNGNVVGKSKTNTNINAYVIGK